MNVKHIDERTILVTMNNHDHTIGNILKNYLLKNKDVVFAGYEKPHTLQNCIRLKIQVKKGDPIAILQSTCVGVQEVLTHAMQCFQTEVEGYKK